MLTTPPGEEVTPGKISKANVDLILATKALRLVINSRGEVKGF